MLFRLSFVFSDSVVHYSLSSFSLELQEKVLIDPIHKQSWGKVCITRSPDTAPSSSSIPISSTSISISTVLSSLLTCN